MPIPSANEIKIPLLDRLREVGEIRIPDAYIFLKDFFQLTDEEYDEKYPSGSDYIFKNRVRFARQHLIDDGVAVSTRTGYLSPIKTDELLTELPTIRQEESVDPLQQIESNFLIVNDLLKSELLDKIISNTWQFFEQLVIDLLIKMGYGSSRQDAAKSFQTTNDEGIDGYINEDTLGLDIIYVQAKKWNNNVSRPDIQGFVGALEGRRATKGVFITTSDFTGPATDYVNNINKQVVLINGKRLTELMIEYKLGVTVISSFDLSRIDRDYFED